MKINKFIIDIFLIFILYLAIYDINCQEINLENKNKSNDNKTNKFSSKTLSFFDAKEEDLKKDDFESEIINRKIYKGTVQTELLNYSYIYEFNLIDSYKESDLILNFYPLDCQIKIVALNSDESAINISKVSNFEYDAFSAIIKKGKIETSRFKIKALINELNENNKKRIYHLVINSFDKNNPHLVLNDKEPTFIYFNPNLNNITLSYESNNIREPVVFSFFIKENINFEAKIMNDEMPKRIIGYKDNIVISSTISSKYSHINITVNKNKTISKNATMIVRASGNNLSPFYLQKNLLNLGFMPLKINNHYYYMEVFKGEEGEIMIHNKLNNAFLRSRIINKNEISDILDVNNFPKFTNEKYNRYNDFSKKLNFSSSDTKNCQDGCYLLITYYSPDIDLKNIDGIEYNILARIWDENKFKPQIINIPLNEYVFGSIEATSINIHYYSLYIPEYISEEDEFFVEFHGRNIKAFAKKGIIKINTFKEPLNSVHITKEIYEWEYWEVENEKLIIKLDKKELDLESFKNTYLSLAFTTVYDDLKKLLNYYYFRIIQKASSYKYIIYPLDTNKANLCQTLPHRQTNSCFFLLKNDFKELYNNFTIYAFGYEEVNYNAWYIKDSDYYTMNFNNIINNKIKISRQRSKGYWKFSLKEDKDQINFIIFEIKSLENEYINVLFNFEGELIPSTSIDVYSYQSFYLKNNIMKNYFFNWIFTNEYLLLINNTYGEGYICFNQNCSGKIIDISQNIILSLTISEKNQSIYIKSERNLFFYLKIKNRLPNDEIEEINYGLNCKNISRYLIPKVYYIKDIYKEGIDINLYFNSSKLSDFENNIAIKGYMIYFDDIKYVNNYNSLEELLNNDEYKDGYIDGTYDICTKSGLISFDNRFSQKQLIQEDIYYLFIIDIENMNSEENNLELSLDILVDSKNHYSQNVLQKDIYIRGSFNLLNINKIQNKTYYIHIEGEKEEQNNINNCYIIEFSSNYKDIQLIFNDDFKYYNKKIESGVQLYYFSTEDLDVYQIYNFTIKINSSNIKNEFDLPQANYILKFYKSQNNSDFVIDKYLEKKKISFNNYSFIMKNKKKNKNINNYYNFTSYITYYNKDYFYNHQLLNTTAFIYYDDLYDYYDDNNFYNIYIITTNDPNEELSFNFYLYDEQDYLLYLFIKINGQNREEEYYSTYFEVSTKGNKNKGISLIIIVLITFGSIFIITIIIFIIACKKFSNKNKDLREKVQAISFSSGIDEDVINKNNRSKDEDDYYTTFI